MSTSCAKQFSRLCECSLGRKGKVPCVIEFTLLKGMIEQKSKYQNKWSKAQLGLYPLI